MLLQNLHHRYLYIVIKLPHLSDLEQRIPSFPNCDNYSSLTASNPDPLLDDTPTNDNELHQVICNTFKIDYFQEMDTIIKLQNRLECKINHTLPALLPNKLNIMEQGLATSGEGIRNKRAIPALAIIQGIATIGGMMIKGIKGINALVDTKRASWLNNAIKLVNENVQITHDQLITLANRTTMMAKTIIPILKDFKQQINNTNDRLNRQYWMMTRAHDRYNRLFRQTHKTFQIHHLALLMVKDYITILVRTLQRIHRQYVRYQSALDNTLIGIEHLNSGYLTHHILDPKILAQYLEAIKDNLEETAPAFEPVFTNVYQYYGNSLISFTNIIDDLLLQLLILIKLKVQVPMSLFSIETAPVPLDAETYLGEKREYTQIMPETELIALTKNNYIPLTQAQISLCAKIGYMYYCEYAHLLKKCTEHTCMSTLYYDQGSDIKAKQCKTIVTFDTILESNILDAGDLLILSNLQKPWTIACKDISRVFEIEYSTYHILNRSELCECSLTAGNYLLSYTNIHFPLSLFTLNSHFPSHFSLSTLTFPLTFHPSPQLFYPPFPLSLSTHTFHLSLFNHPPQLPLSHFTFNSHFLLSLFTLQLSFSSFNSHCSSLNSHFSPLNCNFPLSVSPFNSHFPSHFSPLNFHFPLSPFTLFTLQLLFYPLMFHPSTVTFPSPFHSSPSISPITFYLSTLTSPLTFPGFNSCFPLSLFTLHFSLFTPQLSLSSLTFHPSTLTFHSSTLTFLSHFSPFNSLFPLSFSPFNSHISPLNV